MSISTAPVVLSTLEDAVLTLTINRPEVLNSITDDVLDAITAGCARAAADGDIRVVVITGAGRGFSAGQDLRAGAAGGGDIDVRRHLTDHYHPMVKAIRDLEKPVIASVNGVAAGAGLSLALACDFRVAAESATFIQAFVRIGLVPDAGSSYFLPRLIGTAKAMEMAMLGETVSAADALSVGLVTKVVPDAELTSATREFAARLARGPRSAGLIKQLFGSSLDNDLDTQLAREADAQGQAAATRDFLEGVTAFMEKRAPQFTGT